MVEPKYRRILLKLSGEALVGSGSDSISPEVLEYYAQEIEKLLPYGVPLTAGTLLVLAMRAFGS